jgi:hypothetical protein
MDDRLTMTRDFQNAIYSYYGTTSREVYQEMVMKDFDAMRPNAKAVYNITTTCEKFSVYWNGYSENCNSRCLWEQVEVFDKDGKVKVSCGDTYNNQTLKLKELCS